MTTLASSEAVKWLSREIAEIPDRARLAMRQGFQVLSGLSEEERLKAIELMTRALQEGNTNIDGNIFSSEVLSLTRQDARRLATALSISFALLTQNLVKAEEFLEIARDKIFDPENEPTASAIADKVIGHRDSLGKAMARSRLADAALPSLSQFDVTIDLRIQFDKMKPEDCVSVAIVHLDTDVLNNEIWFQMSRADISKMVEKLQKSIIEMDNAESLLNRAISSEK